MQYRSFRLIKKSELDFIGQRVGQALLVWQKRWCQENSLSSQLEVTAVTGDRPVEEEASWLVGNINDGQSIALSWSANVPDILYNSFVDIKTAFKNSLNVTSLLARKLINHAITSLVQEIFTQFGKETNYIVSSDNRIDELLGSINAPGAGYVLITIKFQEDGILNILLNSESIIEQKAVAKAKGDLSATIKAFGNSTVLVSAKLGTAELNIEDLTRLSVGDVISIDKKLNEKINLMIDNEPFCSGYLGKVGDDYSIQVSD